MAKAWSHVVLQEPALTSGHYLAASNVRFEMSDMIHTSEHKSDGPAEKPPLWAFALAAIALVFDPPGRVDSRRGTAKREDSDPAVVRQGDRRGRAASSPSEIPAKGWKDILLRVY